MLKDIHGMYFDFFGTLIDSNYILTNIWSRIAKRLGTEINSDDKRIQEGMLNQFKEFDKFTKELNRLVTMFTFNDLTREKIHKLNSIVLATMGVDAKASQVIITEEFENEFRNIRSFRLNPGCKKTLEQISNIGIKLGILSNGSKRLKRDSEKFGILEFFDIFILAADLSLNKSKIEVYETALKAMNTECPEKIVHVGDDPFMDVKMAQRVGMVPILLDPNNEFSPQEYDLGDVIVINELPEILQYLK